MSHVTYAMSDIHGELDLLKRAWDWIEEEDARRRLEIDGTTRIVFLGDYIDRGPSSRGVLDWLASKKRVFGSGVVVLRGNHDDMMLQALRYRSKPDEDCWLMNGGVGTLQEYGPPSGALLSTHGVVHGVLDKSAIDEHLDFIESMPLYFEDERRIFVHAGLRSTSFGPIPLAEQKKEDLIWARHKDPAINHGPDWPKMIVHGHTPIRVPAVRDNVLNIDTGAFSRRGALTVAKFVDKGPEAGVTFRRF